MIDIDRSGLNPFADLRLMLRYRSILKRLRPVAYLGFTIKPNIYGCLAAARAGVPAIANISGLGTVFLKRGPLLALVTRLYRRALRKARGGVLPESGRPRSCSRASPGPPGPGALVARLGCRPRPVPAGSAAGRAADLPVHRPAAWRQGRARVGRGGAAGAPECPTTSRFQLLGPLDEGNRTAIARDELDRWVAEGIVDYLGATDDVRPFIARATAVVLPSYREGLPRSLLEAGGDGPAADRDRRSRVPRSGRGRGERLPVRAHDAESLAEAMRKLAGLAPERRSAMGLRHAAQGSGAV